MDLKKEEREKLELGKTRFNSDKLTKEQIEYILGREITIPYWATEEAVAKRKTRRQQKISNTKMKSRPLDIKHLFKEHDMKKRLSALEITN